MKRITTEKIIQELLKGFLSGLVYELKERTKEIPKRYDDKPYIDTKGKFLGYVDEVKKDERVNN